MMAREEAEMIGVAANLSINTIQYNTIQYYFMRKLSERNLNKVESYRR